ncbi:MAG: tetratricopeptide repeat protein [Longimicrobiales bacterium]
MTLRHILRTLAIPALLVSSGCATKGDLRDLSTEIQRSRASQDSSYRALARQHDMLQDSMAELNEALIRLRGDIGNQLVSVEQQLVQIQELTGQSQRRLSELREQVGERMQQVQQVEAAAEAETEAEPAAGGEDVAQLFEIGRENLERGAAGTARRAFEEIVREHPNDALAPEAQLGVAESYAAERQYDQALAAYDRVVELYPSSATAPRALYRAGIVAIEAGNNQRARDYFNRVVRGYPNSDAARLASDQLRRLP